MTPHASTVRSRLLRRNFRPSPIVAGGAQARTRGWHPAMLHCRADTAATPTRLLPPLPLSLDPSLPLATRGRASCGQDPTSRAGVAAPRRRPRVDHVRGPGAKPGPSHGDSDPRPSARATREAWLSAPRGRATDSPDGRATSSDLTRIRRTWYRPPMPRWAGKGPPPRAAPGAVDAQPIRARSSCNRLGRPTGGATAANGVRCVSMC
jgi:hypothetical protein